MKCMCSNFKRAKKTNWRFEKKIRRWRFNYSNKSFNIYDTKIFGEYEKLSGFCKNIYSKENEDYAHLLIKTKTGIICSIDASWSVINYRVPQLKFFIEGINGSILVNEDKIDLNLKNLLKILAKEIIR